MVWPLSIMNLVKLLNRYVHIYIHVHIHVDTYVYTLAKSTMFLTLYRNKEYLIFAYKMNHI